MGLATHSCLSVSFLINCRYKYLTPVNPSALHVANAESTWPRLAENAPKWPKSLRSWSKSTQLAESAPKLADIAEIAPNLEKHTSKLADIAQNWPMSKTLAYEPKYSPVKSCTALSQLMLRPVKI